MDPQDLQDAEAEGSMVDSLWAQPPDLLVEAQGEAVPAGVWIDVVLPGGSGGMTPSVDGIPVAYTRTEWGVRIPIGDLLPGESQVISFPQETPPQVPIAGR